MKAIQLRDVIAPAVNGLVYPLYMPAGEDVFPAIVYFVVSNDIENTIQGTGDEFTRFQIDIYAETYEELCRICEDVIERLETAFESGIRVNDFDDLVEEPKLYRRIIEFIF